MNIGLYDPENTAFLAGAGLDDDLQPTAGTSSPEPPSATRGCTGAFPKKIRDFVLDEERLSMPFVIRSMTGLAADFLGISDRGYLAEGMKADIAVLDPERIRDRATYDDPHRYPEGTAQVLVNGEFAIEDGEATGALAGRALRPQR